MKRYSNYKFYVQDRKKIRVIIDTDAAAEADDQYAIVHALLTPRFEIKGIIAEHFELFNEDKTIKSVDQSYHEIMKLLHIMEVDNVNVVKGADSPLRSEDEVPASAGADLIITEALADDEKPLFVLCQGAITNVAIALNKCPEIADKFTCIWIGGAGYPDGGWEFNLLNDKNAANVALRKCGSMWQVPINCYSRIRLGYAEMQTKILPCGKIGQYLFEEMQELGKHADWIQGESWSLGDSPVVGLTMDPNCGRYEIRKAPVVKEEGRYCGEYDNNIRVYVDIDSRFILEDLFAKLKLQGTEHISCAPKC